jgi:hypothetical protein
MDLEKVFDGISRQMFLDFEQIQSQVKHAGERGSEREASLRTFLRKYLPSKYAVAKGEVVDTWGQTSKQCDLIIYDHSNCPLLLAGEDYRIFPVEPALAVVEVKSVLSVTELKDASEKIKSVKDLKREHGPVAGIVFAYTSTWKRDPISAIGQNLRIINDGLEYYQYIDLLCVLNAGLICLVDQRLSMQIPQAESARIMLVYKQLDLPPLLWFYIQLLELLNGQVGAAPQYMQYAFASIESAGGLIGLVSKHELTAREESVRRGT